MRGLPAGHCAARPRRLTSAGHSLKNGLCAWVDVSVTAAHPEHYPPQQLVHLLVIGRAFPQALELEVIGNGCFVD